MSLVLEALTWFALKQWPMPLFGTLPSASWVKCFPKGTEEMQLNASGKYFIWKNNYLGRQQIGQ